jgi:methylated-DNA-[protein]-cysteine S-methyltransferase
MREVTYVAEEEYASPLGVLIVRASSSGVRRIGFADEKDSRVWRRVDDEDVEAGLAIVLRTRTQLDEYFAGSRHEFDLPLEPMGTPFQVDVWRALLRVPYGATASYASQAGWVGRPRATRAVGGANGSNPLPIVLPCHRIVGASGQLTGYGGGVERKAWLLEHEAKNLPQQS